MIDEVEYQGVYRNIGEGDSENFLDMVFNYACDGYVVEF